MRQKTKEYIRTVAMEMIKDCLEVIFEERNVESNKTIGFHSITTYITKIEKHCKNASEKFCLEYCRNASEKMIESSRFMDEQERELKTKTSTAIQEYLSKESTIDAIVEKLNNKQLR